MERRGRSPQEPERELTPAQTSLVLTDFRTISQQAFAAYEEDRGKSLFEVGETKPRRVYSLTYYPDGLVWFGIEKIEDGKGKMQNLNETFDDYLNFILKVQ